MPLTRYWILAAIALGLFLSGISLMVHYGNEIPSSLTPQEQVDMRSQGATPQQMSDAIIEKRMHSSAFRNTMVGVGLFGGGALLSCGMLSLSRCVGCEDDEPSARVAPAAAAPHREQA